MEHILTKKAPLPIGPYAQAVKTGNLLYCSGQTPLDPTSMKLVPHNIEFQTERALENLKLVLKEAGLSISNIVKVNVFLTDMDLFSGMNMVYTNFFKTHKPARTTVAVSGLPMGALVEIECIAEFN